MDPQPGEASPPAKASRRALKDIKIESGRRTGRAARAVSYGRIAIGSVLGRTFTIYGKGFLPIVLMSLLVYTPLLAFTVWSFRAKPAAAQQSAQDVVMDEYGVDSEPPAKDPHKTWTVVYFWGSLLLAQFLAGPVTYHVVSRLHGRSPGLSDSLRIGLGSVPRILLTVLLFAVYVMGMLFVGGLLVGIPLGLFVSVLGPRLGMVLVAVVYGLGWLWVSGMFWVAVPAAVVERSGPAEALSRSVRLTKRNVWKLIAINGVLMVVVAAMHTGVGFFATGDFEVVAIGQVLLSAVVTGPLGAVGGAIAYHDLRTSAEGIGTEEIARVFE